MIRGELIMPGEAMLNNIDHGRLLTLEEYNNTIDGSINFRMLCINEGFKLIAIYPVFHQGWELDYWGAVGIKDGKQWRLETNHGVLVPVREDVIIDGWFNCIVHFAIVLYKTLVG